MSIVFQDPGAPKPTLLLEALSPIFESGELIFGAFAFVTERGLSLLFDQEEIQRNLASANVHLVVGMGAITDARALNKLKAISDAYPRFSPKAFLPETNGIFHPKASFCRRGKTGMAIVGSGNLTAGGLKNNFEAFSVTDLDARTTAALEESWRGFLAHNQKCLFDVDSQRALDAAKINTLIYKAEKKVRQKDSRKPVKSGAIPEATSTVFIEDLTKGRGARQRDVGLWPSENYFGENRSLFLTHVKSDGGLDPVEVRRISRKDVSHNAALDLRASEGLGPDRDRQPIAVFIRTSQQDFFYHVLAPDSPDYPIVAAYLEQEAVPARVGSARRIPDKKRPAAVSVDELRRVWPGAPFWKISNDNEDIDE